MIQSIFPQHHAILSNVNYVFKRQNKSESDLVQIVFSFQNEVKIV